MGFTPMHEEAVEKVVTHLVACGGRQPSVSCSLARLYGLKGPEDRKAVWAEVMSWVVHLSLMEPPHERFCLRQSIQANDILNPFLTAYNNHMADVAVARLVSLRLEIELVGQSV